jgi:hypothetical protein
MGRSIDLATRQAEILPEKRHSWWAMAFKLEPRTNFNSISNLNLNFNSMSNSNLNFNPIPYFQKI